MSDLAQKMESKTEKRAEPKPDFWRLDRRLADNTWLLKVSVLLNFFLLIAALIFPLISASLASRTVQVAVVDPHGNIYSTQTERLLESTAAVKLTAESFLLASLAKDPNGFKYKEMLKQVTTAALANQIEKYFEEKEAQDFALRKIHQFPEIGKIQIINRSGNLVVVAVNYQLIRNGTVDGANFTESPQAKLTLTMKVAEFLTSGQTYPLQVVEAVQ